jgi:copper transport protein
MALVVVSVLLGTAQAVSAHANLQSSSPVPDETVEVGPGTVSLIFDEAVNVSLGGVQVLSPNGERADRGRTASEANETILRAPVDAVERGTYTVSWRVVSADGHPLSGSYLFHVGEQTGGIAGVDDSDSVLAKALSVAFRWLAYAGSLLAVGTLALSTFGFRGIAPVPKRAYVLLVTSSLAVAVGSIGLLVVEVMRSSGRGLVDALNIVPDAVINVRFAQLEALRGLSSAYAALGWALMLKRSRLSATAYAAGAATVVAFFVPSVAGHAWTATPAVLAVFVDALHLSVVALWAGGLGALLFLFPGGNAGAKLAQRFSRSTLVVVVVVGITGSISAWLQLQSLGALTGSTYGQLLIAKVAVVGILVLIGYSSRKRLGVLVERTSSVIAKLRASGIVALAVVALTAVLVQTAPPAFKQSESFSATAETADGSVAVVLDPAQVGSNIFHVYFQRDGLPVAVDAAELAIASGDTPLRRVHLTPVTPSHLSALNLLIPTKGVWKFQVTEVRNGKATTTKFEVDIK